MTLRVNAGDSRLRVARELVRGAPATNPILLAAVATHSPWQVVDSDITSPVLAAAPISAAAPVVAAATLLAIEIKDRM